MLKKSINILFAGVGGQGVLLASEIVANVFLKSGYDVKSSALHGIAQRGGSVTSHVRIGKKIYSPLIPQGVVDFIVGLELSETARQAWKIKKEGHILYIDRQIPSCRQTKTNHSNVKTLKKIINEKSPNAREISYGDVINLLKNEKVLNLFMLGMLSHHFTLPSKKWIETIEQLIPLRMKERNIFAFEAGQKRS